VAGFAPSLDECAVCGTRVTAARDVEGLSPAERSVSSGSGEPRAAAPPGAGTPRRAFWFSIAAGGLVCRDCRAPGAATPSAQTIALMSALIRGDWGLADRSERRQQAECSGLVAAYLQWHLENAIRSLRHVEHV
jgi:DNA repair protein RecO (recombination protein O)